MSEEMRVCQRCDCAWASEVGDVDCWFCAEADSKVTRLSWSARMDTSLAARSEASA